MAYLHTNDTSEVNLRLKFSFQINDWVRKIAPIEVMCKQYLFHLKQSSNKLSVISYFIRNTELAIIEIDEYNFLRLPYTA